MKVPKRILAVAALAVVGILGPQATPAHAQMAGGFVAVGSATTSGNLSTPVGPNCGVGLCPTPGHVNFSISAFGIGVLAMSTTAVGGPTFSLHGHGSVGPAPKTVPLAGPYCGLSSGSLTAHWSWTGVMGSFHGSGTLHWAVSVGSALLLTGTGGTSAAVVVALAVPPNTPSAPGQSCTNGTAKDFTVVTAGVIAHA